MSGYKRMRFIFQKKLEVLNACLKVAVFICLTAMPSRKSYSLEKKLQVLKRYHELEKNCSATSREFSISRRVIERWVKQEDSIRHENRRAKKHGNTGRKRRRIPRAENACHFPDMEDLLASWIREKRESSLAVHVKAIRTEAKKIFRDLYGEDQRPFSASTGWLSRFLRRHKLVSRRVTSVGQLMPSNAPTSAKTFIKDVSNAISTGNIATNCIGNMDESPFWFDMPSNETYDFEGVKTVKSKTTG